MIKQRGKPTAPRVAPLFDHPAVVAEAEELAKGHILGDVTAAVLEMSQLSPDEEARKSLQAVIALASAHIGPTKVALLETGYTMVEGDLSSLRINFRAVEFPGFKLLASAEFQIAPKGWGELRLVSAKAMEEDWAAIIRTMSTIVPRDWLANDGEMIHKVLAPSGRHDLLTKWHQKMRLVFQGCCEGQNKGFVTFCRQAEAACWMAKSPAASIAAYLVSPQLFAELKQSGACVTNWRGMPLWLLPNRDKPSTTKELQALAFKRVDQSALADLTKEK